MGRRADIVKYSPQRYRHGKSRARQIIDVQGANHEILNSQAPSTIGGVPMAADDLDRAIEQSHAALDAILKGDPKGYKALYSDREDVTLGNPFGPYARGRTQVEDTLAGAASHYRDGEITRAELVAKYASDDLACVVEVERGRAKVGGGEELVPVAVHVTSVFRLERGAWKLVHRHADPITAARPAESVIEKSPNR
jgi:ketosteroid isomerase-like protein